MIEFSSYNYEAFLGNSGMRSEYFIPTDFVGKYPELSKHLHFSNHSWTFNANFKYPFK